MDPLNTNNAVYHDSLTLIKKSWIHNNTYVSHSFGMFGKSEKKGPKILDQCLFPEQQVPPKFIFVKRFLQDPFQ